MLTASFPSGQTLPRHGFFTRQGGVSEGIFASLNCGLGSGDDPERVRENRHRVAQSLGIAVDSLVTLRQVHSSTVVEVDAPWDDKNRPEADALVTRRRDVALGILTADCTPVLLADETSGVVGALHAGWRGAKAGIIAATVAAMERQGAQRTNIRAAVGPCIQQPSYEVGTDFRASFLADDPASADLFVPAARADKALFNLPGYVIRRLAQTGVAEVAVCANDTLSDENRFFSFRRVTLAGGGPYGRMISAITLAE